MNRYIHAVRALAAGEPPKASFNFAELLRRHRCYYLLQQLPQSPEQKAALQAENSLNRVSLKQRYKTCAPLFQAFGQAKIPYAVIKGAVFSQTAYRDPACRHSGDLDLLINKNSIEPVKAILKQNGFVQGRVTAQGLQPFTRREILFQAAFSHQTAPFICQTANPLSPFVNVDLNFCPYWGEYQNPPETNWILTHTVPAEILGVRLQKLEPELELIALCLHHYKDFNSVYMLWEKGLSLGHFCDIYFALKNQIYNLKKLLEYAKKLRAEPYLYYCLYYTQQIFGGSVTAGLLPFFESEKATALLPCFGLTPLEQQTWQIDFCERLFTDDLRNYLAKTLPPEALEKIKLNEQNM